MRSIPALIATAAVVAVALTGCSAGGAASDCTGGAAAGESSKIVKVGGEFGSAPDVTFPTPLKTDSTERSVVADGTGAGIVEGQKVTVEMAVYNGTTGKLIEKTGYGSGDQGPVPLVVSDSQVQKGLVKGLECATQGSRNVIVVPPKDAFGTAGNDSIGIGPDDNLVFVVDVVKTYLTRANGAPQPAQNGFPAVVLADNGQPGITIPSDDPPSELKVAVLRKGEGAEVKKGDSVTVHYTGVLWNDDKPGTVFDSSWDRGTPASLTAASGADVQGGVIEGFADALIGQKVGSQIIAVIPPDKAYGEQENGSIPANSTLVFVVDILGIDG